MAVDTNVVVMVLGVAALGVVLLVSGTARASDTPPVGYFPGPQPDPMQGQGCQDWGSIPCEAQFGWQVFMGVHDSTAEAFGDMFGGMMGGMG